MPILSPFANLEETSPQFETVLAALQSPLVRLAANSTGVDLDDDETIQKIVSDMQAMLADVQSKSGPDHVHPAQTPVRNHRTRLALQSYQEVAAME
jgi:hypothetical protein